MVFVDTGAWFVATDPDHAAVSHWMDANAELLLTTDYCVAETLTLLIARKRPRLAAEAGRALFQEDLARLHFLTPDQIRRAFLQFESRADAGWSFTDWTSKVVIDELDIKTAVALDAHFHQFGIAVAP